MEPPQLFFIILGILLVILSPITFYFYFKAIKTKSTHFPLMRGKTVLSYKKWTKDDNNLLFTLGTIKLLSSAVGSLIIGIVFICIGLILF